MPKCLLSPPWITILCPACREYVKQTYTDTDEAWWTNCGIHTLDLGDGKWSFDGNMDAPTINPSIKAIRHYKDVEFVCHSYVRNGRIEYQGDSTHSLAGQSIELPDTSTWAHLIYGKEP